MGDHEVEAVLNTYQVAFLAREVIAAELCRIRDVRAEPENNETDHKDAAAIIDALTRQGLYVEVAG